MIGASAAFGLLAVFVAQGWLNRQAELKLKSMAQPEKVVATHTVVVATSPLRFGDQLSQRNLREVAWPNEAVPADTFSTVADALKNGRRTVLASIAANEPVLRKKVTGPGEKATLSALLQQGMKAVTIRVNDVDGVAGFVLPGDHVDVMLTRQADKAKTSTEVVLQKVRVLAVDQSADESIERPTVAKAVTLEVDTMAAQKLSLAGSVGSLSLALRKAGETDLQDTRQVTLGDLGDPQPPSVPAPLRAAATADPPRFTQSKQFAIITVTRGTKTQEYSVLSERPPAPAEGVAAAAAAKVRGLFR